MTIWHELQFPFTYLVDSQGEPIVTDTGEMIAVNLTPNTWTPTSTPMPTWGEGSLSPAPWAQPSVEGNNWNTSVGSKTTWS